MEKKLAVIVDNKEVITETENIELCSSAFDVAMGTCSSQSHDACGDGGSAVQNGGCKMNWLKKVLGSKATNKESAGQNKLAQAENKERFKQEIQPYVEEGLVRDVFDTQDFTITCAANSAYAIYFHNEVDPETKLTWGFFLKGKEFETFMEEPTVENFKWLNHACQKRNDNRAVLFTPQLAQKFRELKARLDRENKTEVDLVLEQKLVDEARKRYQ